MHQIACGAPRAFVQYAGAAGAVYGLAFRSVVRLVSKTASRNSIVPFVETEFHTSDHEPFAQAGRIGRFSLPLAAPGHEQWDGLFLWRLVGATARQWQNDRYGGQQRRSKNPAWKAGLGRTEPHTLRLSSADSRRSVVGPYYARPYRRRHEPAVRQSNLRAGRYAHLADYSGGSLPADSSMARKRVSMETSALRSCSDFCASSSAQRCREQTLSTSSWRGRTPPKDRIAHLGGRRTRLSYPAVSLGWERSVEQSQGVKLLRNCK
jgi:hypothetical protein